MFVCLSVSLSARVSVCTSWHSIRLCARLQHNYAYIYILLHIYFYIYIHIRIHIIWLRDESIWRDRPAVRYNTSRGVYRCNNAALTERSIDLRPRATSNCTIRKPHGADTLAALRSVTEVEALEVVVGDCVAGRTVSRGMQRLGGREIAGPRNWWRVT